MSKAGKEKIWKKVKLKKSLIWSQARSQARKSGKSQQMCLAAPSAKNPRWLLPAYT